MQAPIPTTVNEQLKKLCLPLLCFLLIFTVDKIVLKFAGIALVFILNPDFSFKQKIKQIPLFYIFIILIEIIKFFLLNKDFSKAHFATLAVGCIFWLLAFLALYQVNSLLQKEKKKTIDNTLLVFFIISTAVSLFQLLWAMIHSGSINPYTSGNEIYGTSTGDRIKGLFLGPCYINMMINCFFLFYFLFRNQFWYAFLAVVVIAITTSNFANIVLAGVLLACLVLKKGRKIKFAIIGYFSFLFVFYMLVSPSNFDYLLKTVFGDKKQQQELVAYQHEVNKASNDSTSRPVKIEYDPARVDKLLNDTSLANKPDSTALINEHSQYGKLIAFKETYHYITSGVKPFIFGAGIGSYSSFLAERMSKVNQQEGSRLFTYMPEYIAPTFEKDHYKIFKTVYGLPKVFHSIKHFPNSFLNQLFGEYGILGALLFFFTYVLFFLKRFKSLTYGRYLLLLLGGFLLFDYLFEYLSVVTFFELFLLKDIRDTQNPANE